MAMVPSEASGSAPVCERSVLNHAEGESKDEQNLRIELSEPSRKQVDGGDWWCNNYAKEAPLLDRLIGTGIRRGCWRGLSWR